VAAREDIGTQIAPGVIERVKQGMRYVLSGVTPESWFGPGQPLAPVAQDKTEGRAFDYPVALNLRFQPRSEEQFSFSQLRGIADSYDLMRLVIETRKDQVKAYEWEVMPVDEKADPTIFADQIKVVSDFMERPDKEHDFDDWISMVVEDMLVIDAVCVYPRKTKGGKLYGLELVDGATIKRVLDISGRTPLPPDPAYQQILKGIPAADYTTDDLTYMMRNPRSSRIYGLSPVEQVMMTVNIAMRRQLSQLAYYSEGNIPEAIAQVPEGWTAKQIQDFQLWWDSLMEGNAAQKRKMRFIPSLDNILFPKEAVLKDQYDEWLARVICFAFSIPPTPFIMQVNRATAQQGAESAKEEGLLPLMKWLDTKINFLLKTHLGGEYLGVKFTWKKNQEVAPDVKATIHSTYIAAKVITPDEAREELGMMAMTPDQRKEAFPEPPPPGMMVDETGQQVPVPKAPDPNADTNDEAPGAQKAPAKETAAEKMLASALAMLDPDRIAAVVAKVAAAQPPTIVEHRPEINVEVGDTTVNAFKPRNPPDERMGKVLVGRRMPDGSMQAFWKERDAPDLSEIDGERQAS
jgi:PAS domain-containing protein